MNATLIYLLLLIYFVIVINYMVLNLQYNYIINQILIIFAFHI
jgi:hypothetical protein